MATQLTQARSGVITDEMRRVAADEGATPEAIRERLARGTLVIPKNVHHDCRPLGVGEGLRTKVNANLGASGLHQLLDEEVKKLAAALEHGADAVMDLSTGVDIDRVREELLQRCPVALGTVPLYQVAAEASILSMDIETLFGCIERQARQGVDFMTVHCGVTRESVRHLRAHERQTGIVSRGGALLAAWIEATGQENPLYEHFDRLCDIFAAHDVTFSLGDGLRPGATGDASDRGQVAELLILGELAERARARGCQVMIEGPGHMPLDQIQANVLLEKRLCGGAPFYVLGPLPIDFAPGYDHITAAIGAAEAARYGADLICYITPAEHLALPNEDDVREGVRATRLAAQIGDLAKYPERRDLEKRAALTRRDSRWAEHLDLLLFPEKAKEIRASRMPAKEETCTMCGDFCANRKGMELFSDCIGPDKRL
jgi:phosphomethylpyrimidine synthase